MKSLTARTYIKHIKRLMDFDDARDNKVRKTHPVMVWGRRSEKLLLIHGLIDEEGDAMDCAEPEKVKALKWWRNNM